MNQAIILIDDRAYTSWRFVCMERTTISIDTLPPHFHPLHDKLITRDVIDIHTGKLIHRNLGNFAGVLILEGNKTYGRSANKKRLLYRCIPNDRYLPEFLVPYEIKLAFEKNIQNKYVVIEFDEWTQKHPWGKLVEVLGDVGVLDAFYEYQIYCRSLNISLAEFNSKTCNAAKEEANYLNRLKTLTVEDTTPHIITIDPEGSLDYDDAFGVEVVDEDSVYVHVYIANVYLWLEVMGLWKSFSRRVATIYLPHRRRPMLPTVLSDSLCSLVQKKLRVALRMRVLVKDREIQWNTVEFENVHCTIFRNYSYDSGELNQDVAFQYMQQISKTTTSHDAVSFWMIAMNRECGKILLDHGKGVFRSMNWIDSSAIPDTKDIPMREDARMCIRNWHNTIGQYVLSSDASIRHEFLKLDCYVHITSPIRRIVDLLNQMEFIMLFKKNLSEEAAEFLEHWLGQLEYINTAMRSIRKVQTDCHVLYQCTIHPEWKDIEHQGIVFDCLERIDGTYSYMVYLEDTKILSRVYSTYKWNNYSKRNFRIYLFDDETKLCSKIRVVG